MKHINFPESNIVMKAGDNQNTESMRVMLSNHPGYDPDPKSKLPVQFFSGKFELDAKEKLQIAETLLKVAANRNVHDHQLIKDLVDALPPLWVTCMHGWFPISLSVESPQEMGYEKVALPVQPIDN